MLTILLIAAAALLAYSNGANDNFKGVATLYGSGTLSYRAALTIATLATMAGSVCAIFLAHGLIANFSGKGLVPQQTAETLSFLIAVGLGAASTVFMATRLGLPVSTTHALVGGLLGGGLMAVGSAVNFQRLGTTFVIPLLVSPFIAFALGFLVYSLFNRARTWLGLTKESCVCVGERAYQPTASLACDGAALIERGEPALTLADQGECAAMYTDKVWGISLQQLLDRAHIVSAAAVSFARGLNDTPKIAGLLVALKMLSINFSLVALALAMALGGLLNARRVAETVSHKITDINHGQGFSANIVTSFLVIVASKFGVPVSTTHVSVGAIFGIGAVSRTGNARTIAGIILSWLVTVPVAALFGGAYYWLLSHTF